MTKNIIEVSNFTKRYGSFTAVDNISFSVREGSIFAFLGPNGAGKSTTINTLCTILDKTEGSLTINGNDAATQQARVRKDIGIVFQEHTLDGGLTVEENLKLHCAFYQVPRAEISERIRFALELVDLTDRRRSLVKSLSGGMKRRAEIARALVHTPKVLFLDEPTAGLDPQTRASIWDYIVALQKKNGMTIFLTTHYLDEAEICDRVAVMDHGRIVANDTPFRLKQQYTRTSVRLETPDATPITQYLDAQGMDYRHDGKILTVLTDATTQTLELVSRFKSQIHDIEMNKGTLNDVFLAITGKEIRN